MKRDVTLLIWIGCLLYTGCSRRSDEELWMKIEQAKSSKNWDSTLQVSKVLLKEYPQSRYAGWAQFGVAESYRFKSQPREALDNYKIFYNNYPDMQPSAVSLFLIGYIYNNDLQLQDSAKVYYNLFLEKYPNHDLAPSVKGELETLGKDPAQILDEKQKKLATK
jgi:tetratricopeptide (TPR) repeat protein